MSAIEAYTGRSALDITDRELSAIQRAAQLLAKSSMVPKRFKDKADDLVIVGLSLYPLGIDLTLNTLGQTWVADGKVNLMAQIQLGIAASHHIDAWFEPGDVTEEFATVSIRKPGNERVDRYTYTIDMARKAGLLDEWVEKWSKGENGWKLDAKIVIAVDGVATPESEDLPDWAKKQVADGRVKRKDPWFRARQQMLMARAVTMGLKIAAPGILLGIPTLDLGDDDVEAPARPHPVDVGVMDDPLDDEIADADIVERDEPGSGEPAAGDHDADDPRRAMADAADRQSIAERLTALGVEFTQQATVARKAKSIPALNSGFLTKADVAAMGKVLDAIEAQATETWSRRRAHANAKLGEVGIKGDARRDAIEEATKPLGTDATTRSSGKLTEPQKDAIVAYCDALKAAEAETTRLPVGDPDDPSTWDESEF